MKRFIALFAALTVVACASSPAKKQEKTPSIKVPTLAKYKSDPGDSPVGVIPTALLHDAQRNKDVDVAIAYPTKGTGPFPIIIFSHGFGVAKLAYESLASYWTTYGYVVIRPAHADAGQLRDPALEEMLTLPRDRQPQPKKNAPPPTTAAPPPAKPNPLDALMEKEREPQWRDRVRDITLIIDSLNDLDTRFPELKGKMDHTKIGVGGHSYGAFTTMLVAGARTFSAPPLSLGDPRVTAGMAFSPQGVFDKLGLTADSWREVKIPMLYMTGSLDRGSVEGQGPEWRRGAFDNSPAGDKYFVLIDGARHSSFTGSSFGPVPTDTRVTQMEPMIDPTTGRQTSMPVDRSVSPRYGMANDRNVQQTIRVVSLAFWDAYLKADAKAREQLNKPENFGDGVELAKK
jgi:predicted dienelactone hydrolase